MHRLKTRKNPTGSTVEDLLNEAIERGDFDNLPGKGKPFSLEGYFSVHPDQQLPSQLLIDNKVIPQSLQDRKDAEILLEKARNTFMKGEKSLAGLREKIARNSAPVVSVFRDRATLMRAMNLETWPSCFAEPSADSKPHTHRLDRHIERLRIRMNRYNHQAEQIIKQYMEHIIQANERIRRLNTNLMEGSVVGGSQLQRQLLDLDTYEREIHARCVRLTLLPEDAAARLQTYIRETYPSFWRRFIYRQA